MVIYRQGLLKKVSKVTEYLILLLLCDSGMILSPKLELASLVSVMHSLLPLRRLIPDLSPGMLSYFSFGEYAGDPAWETAVQTETAAVHVCISRNPGRHLTRASFLP